jgi:hypothetical protein
MFNDQQHSESRNQSRQGRPEFVAVWVGDG